ncbi:hypothetical protein B0H19DRAFT_1075606 [Mycena capillaripes]|nr:hypothetical protein B0H19DRAFT_1075606 [Mycena capillaripes]
MARRRAQEGFTVCLPPVLTPRTSIAHSPRLVLEVQASFELRASITCRLRLCLPAPARAGTSGHESEARTGGKPPWSRKLRAGLGADAEGKERVLGRGTRVHGRRASVDLGASRAYFQDKRGGVERHRSDEVCCQISPPGPFVLASTSKHELGITKNCVDHFVSWCWALASLWWVFQWCCKGEAGRFELGMKVEAGRLELKSQMVAIVLGLGWVRVQGPPVIGFKLRGRRRIAVAVVPRDEEKQVAFSFVLSRIAERGFLEGRMYLVHRVGTQSLCPNAKAQDQPQDTPPEPRVRRTRHDKRRSRSIQDVHVPPLEEELHETAKLVRNWERRNWTKTRLSFELVSTLRSYCIFTTLDIMVGLAAGIVDVQKKDDRKLAPVDITDAITWTRGYTIRPDPTLARFHVVCSTFASRSRGCAQAGVLPPTRALDDSDTLRLLPKRILLAPLTCAATRYRKTSRKPSKKLSRRVGQL